MQTRLRSLTFLFALSISTGCQENVVSRDHFDTPFSIYGVISPQLDTQSVRVYPLEDFPTLGSPAPPDANVSSTDLETGEQVPWRDSVHVDPNGQHEYIYWALFRAEYGHRYQIDVLRRSDGARSFAEVRVPEPVTVRIIDDTDASRMQVLIEGEGIRALSPEVTYIFSGTSEGCEPLVDQFSYEGYEQPVDNGWIVPVNMVSDRFDLLFNCGGVTVFPRNFCPPYYIGLKWIELDMIIGDHSWDPPAGVFDPNVVSHPTTMTNVENGFGIVAAGFRVTAKLFPSEAALQHACFTYGDSSESSLGKRSTTVR